MPTKRPTIDLPTLLARGHSLRFAATRLGISLSKAWRTAKKMGCERRQHLTSTQKNLLRGAVRTSRDTNVAIAKRIGVHPSTVSRYRASITSERETLETPRRCGNCGKLRSVWPCVECQPHV